MTKIIIIEDNPTYNTFISKFLAKAGFKSIQVHRLFTAKKHLLEAGDDDIVLAALRLSDGESTELLRWMKDNDRLLPFIIMTNYAEVHTAVECMRLGSIDYMPKLLIEDRLLPLLHTIVKEQEENREYQNRIFVRQGTAYQNMLKRIRLVAPTRLNVLVLGESGTGKEHIARQIHLQSKLAAKPFVAVDCGSLTPSLAPSAFFGHVKGAFTGADYNVNGYFQEANGGTLFLDEIGNLPMETQQMLLRAIQENCYRPVGAKENKNTNIRIVSATNEDLQRAIKERRFRQDLFYRLQGYVITAPPLRDCPEDIMPLAGFFREVSNRELERAVKGFDSSAREALLLYTWPGNVRELKQKIQRAVLQAESDMITEADLELDYETIASTPGCFALRSDEEEKERIIRALEHTNGNKILAAKLLGIGRTTLYTKMEKYEITIKKTIR